MLLFRNKSGVYKANSQEGRAKMKIAYSGKLVLIGCTIGLITLIFSTLYLLELPIPNDCLSVGVLLLLPLVALARWLRGDKLE